MQSLQLPFSQFSKKDERSNAASDAWQLDLTLKDAPVKIFSLIVFQDGPVDTPSIISEVSQRCRQTIQYQYQLLEGQNISVTTEDFFEQCLQKVNNELAIFLRDINVALPVQSWAMVIGMLTPDETYKKIHLSVSRFGEVTGWLLNHAQLDTQKLISIFDTPDHLPDQQRIPHKFFRHVMSSTIPKSDQLFFCTPNLLNYISLSELKNILSTLSVFPAVKHLENQTQLGASDHLVAGISLRLSPHPIKSEQEAQQQMDLGAQHSMSALNTTTAQTQKFLGNASGLQITALLNEGIAYIKSLSSKNRLHYPSDRTGDYARDSRQAITRNTKSGVIIIRRVTGALANLITKPESRKRDTMDMLSTNQTITKISAWKEKLFSLLRIILRPIRNRVNKQMLSSPITYVAAGIIIAGGTGLFFYQQHEQQEQEQREQVEASLAEIRDDINKIDAHLIVGREEDATNLLQQSRTALAEIPSENGFGEEKSNLRELLQQQQRKLHKETPISLDSSIVSDLTSQLSTPPRRLAAAGNTLYVLPETPNKLLIHTPGQNETSVNEITTDVTTWTASGATEQGNIVLLRDNNVTEMNPDSGETATSTANVQTAFSGVSFYNNRLYTISKQDNQIYRSNSGGNFSVLSTWLDTEEDLSQARDLAIDGSIFVLNPDGVAQYLRGTPANPGITLEQVDPPLQDARRIWTSADTNNLYILEPQRLLVFSKTGEFTRQYRLAEGETKDMHIVPEDGTAYLLIDDAILEIGVES